MKGIYCYKDLKNNKIVYIGKDSHIEKDKRHKQHMARSHYNNQPFNRALQNNSSRYIYSRLKEGNFSEKLLNALEILYIRRYNPKFNFTKGGDGVLGLKQTHETIEKKSGRNHPFYGKPHPTEVCKKISDAHKGKRLSKNTLKKMSESQNNTGYFRVSKVKHEMYSQGFTWRYKYYDENGKRRVISSVDIKKLEEKVKSKGLEWFVL